MLVQHIEECAHLKKNHAHVEENTVIYSYWFVLFLDDADHGV